MLSKFNEYAAAFTMDNLQSFTDQQVFQLFAHVCPEVSINETWTLDTRYEMVQMRYPRHLMLAVINAACGDHRPLINLSMRLHRLNPMDIATWLETECEARALDDEGDRHFVSRVIHQELKALLKRA